MKKKLLTLHLLAAAFFANEQNAGINTTTPQATLDVRGSPGTGSNSNYLKYDSAAGKNVLIIVRNNHLNRFSP